MQNFNINKIKKIMHEGQCTPTTKYFLIDKQKKPQPNRKQGVVFYQNGKLWTIKGGIQVQHEMTDRDNCPVCKKWCHRRMDLKYLRAQNMCEDCFLQIQTQMRVDGTWDDYISKIQLDHAIGYLTDNVQELQSTREQTQRGFIQFVQNSTGECQNWELPKKHIINTIDQKIKDIKQKIQKFTEQRNKIIERMESRKNG